MFGGILRCIFWGFFFLGGGVDGLGIGGWAMEKDMH